MKIQEKITELISKIKKLRTNSELRQKSALPSGCYFLSDDEILCGKRRFGDGRYPYSCDGLTLWAYSSGNVKIEESTFNVILGFTEGKEPNLAFFVGKALEDGFFPVSITGAGKLPFEKDIERYTIFTPEAAYYFTETKEFLACVRMFVDMQKNVRFTTYLENKTDKPLNTYVSAYFNCMISHGNYEYIETKWYRSVKAVEDGFALAVTECVDRNTLFENKATIIRDTAGMKVFSTTSHTDYCGGMHNQLCCSTALQTGKFEEEKAFTEFTDTAVAGDIIPLALEAKANYCVSYTLTLSDAGCKQTTTKEIDNLAYAKKDANGLWQNIPKIEIEGEWNGIDGKIFENFLKNVFRQTEFCARAKNYAGPHIGVRDVFQQLEASIMWIPEYCREKIVEALNYIGDDGRAPRGYSYPKNENVLPSMDLRLFIDQGVWIISTVYKYLAYTGDLSILDEECGYYKFEGNKVGFSKDRDSVLGHIIRITEFLISNIDEETSCLRALYGDWNDALDGLGKTKDKDKEYGNGVSVMASLQLYRNLQEMSEILYKLGKDEEAIRYESIRAKMQAGLQKYAIVENGKGERKILHGWGDKRAHLVGSFCDSDGQNRDGLTTNAYWVISGMFDNDQTLKKDILAAYTRLDSKFGLKTFEPYFGKDNHDVGRINRLPVGTAENAATYIHATLFGIWSLFEMGEEEKAWEQLYKILPITHESISTSPFVMPNSYVENPEKGFNGESMNDWFTGSGCVLLKVLLWHVFGIRANLESVEVKPSKYMPFNKMSIALSIKGKPVQIIVENNGNISIKE